MKKLKLDQLKVKSFVTTVDNGSSHTIAGGARAAGPGEVRLSVGCPTQFVGCESDWKGPCQPSEYMTACVDTNMGKGCVIEIEVSKVGCPDG